MNKWYEKAGPQADVVCSTRVRLARNLQAYPFPSKASQKEKEELEEKIKDALLSGNSVLSREFSFLPLESLTREAAISLAERRLVSPEFLSQEKGRGILLSEDESVSIMINEEDHLRLQVLMEGLSLKEAAEKADRVETVLSETLPFAYDQEFGYLTECPTNLGTGMRASVMLHLPALTENGGMARISANLSKLGLTLRGTYGEGTQVQGNLYQLSNQITLGLSEDEAVENLYAISNQLIGEERKLRERFGESIQLQDKVCRAAGVLKSAQLLSAGEFMQLISLVRFGLSTGILKGLSWEEVNSLTVAVQPATLMARQGKAMEQEERDRSRAQLVRQACGALKEE